MTAEWCILPHHKKLLRNGLRNGTKSSRCQPPSFPYPSLVKHQSHLNGPRPSQIHPWASMYQIPAYHTDALSRIWGIWGPLSRSMGHSCVKVCHKGPKCKSCRQAGWKTKSKIWNPKSKQRKCRQWIWNTQGAGNKRRQQTQVKHNRKTGQRNTD